MRDQKKYEKLIFRSFSDSINKEEEKELQNWLREDPGHRSFYEKMSTAWLVSGIYDPKKKDHQNEDWQAIRRKLHLSEPFTNKKDPTRSVLPSFLKYAAVFIVAFGMAWAVYHFIPAPAQKNKITYNQIITRKGQKAKVILSDGSEIWLNAQSRLRYPSAFSDNERKVSLSGEAFFNIKKTSDRKPFLIETGKLKIRVTGTRFNVKAYPDEDVIETTLVEGSITLLRKVGNEYQTIHLKPDQKATLIKNGADISIDEIRSDKPTIAFMKETSKKTVNKKEKIVISPQVNIAAHVGWKNDRLIFENETFEDIAYELERWFDVKIIFMDNSLKKYRYTGKFIHKESLEEILSVIQMTTPFKFKTDKNNVIIYK